MFSNNLSVALLKLCDRSGLSYERAAERCEISARRFSNLVRRVSAPPLGTLEKLLLGETED